MAKLALQEHQNLFELIVRGDFDNLAVRLSHELESELVLGTELLPSIVVEDRNSRHTAQWFNFVIDEARDHGLLAWE